MRKSIVILFVLFLLMSFLVPGASSLKAGIINDDPNDEIVNDGPWADPANRPNFYLGNTEESSVQNVFINGKPLNPSVYFFSIHKEVFLPVRVITYALGGKVYWDPVNRKVYINGKELNTTRVVLGYNCYVPIRSVTEVFKGRVSYNTKNHSAAVWTTHPAELGYPLETWMEGTSEYFDRLHKQVRDDQEKAKLDAAREALKSKGVQNVDQLDEDFLKQYTTQDKTKPNTQPSPLPPPPSPNTDNGNSTVQPPPPPPPPGTTPVPTNNKPNPFNFGF